MPHDLDDLDRGLLHALQIDARAPFARIAEVLGVSDRTVARRYTRLRATAGLRLVGRTDPRPLGDLRWFLRVRTAPEEADEIAAALARRPDTAWVHLVSAGTEINCAARAPDSDDGRSMPAAIGRARGVREVVAQRLLHVYFGGPRNVLTKYGGLDASQSARLERHLPGPPRAADQARVDDADRRLLAMLALDARASLDDLAAGTGLPASTARRRLDVLRSRGVLYFDVALRPGVLESSMRTALWLQVPPQHLAEVGLALSAHREVAFAAATTGATTVYASLLTRDDDELYAYLAGPLGELPGVRAVETAPVLRTYKTQVTAFRFVRGGGGAGAR